MKYIVFDLEFNQFNENIDTQKNRNLPYEIIQIGAIKLDENLNIISTFDKLIKPQIYTTVHPFVKELTGITTEQLLNEKIFTLVYEDFINFIDNDKCIFCIWGMVDIKELYRNINFYKLNLNFIPNEYINLQFHTSKHFNCPRGNNIGLRNATELLDISINNQFHNAFNDAIYTVEIFKKLFNEQLKTKVYTSKTLNRTNTPIKKKKLDTDKLIKQFEKIYNRKMTQEEKNIIKLAYLMGNTNQFQI